MNRRSPLVAIGLDATDLSLIDRWCSREVPFILRAAKARHAVPHAHGVLDDRGLARRLGDNARRAVATRFTWENAAAETEAVYGRLLGRA